MSKKDIKETEISILSTNSTKMDFEQDDQPLSKKQILKIVAVVAAVVVFVAALLVVGGIVSKNIEEKRWLREPDESKSVYGETDVAPIVTDRVEAVVTKAYYTNERGLQVFLNFGNGFKEEQQITKIYITVRDENEQGKVIAKGNTDELNEKTIVPAEGNLDFELYIPPRYVAIKDNSLEKTSWDVTLEYVSVK